MQACRVRPESLVFAVALPILPALRRPRYLVAVAAVLAAIQEHGTELFRPNKVKVERYRYRGTRIILPWMGRELPISGTRSTP